MAVKKLTRPTSSDFAEFLEALEVELRRDEQASAPPGAPTFLMEESDTPDNYTHWYVVWDRFGEVDNEERSRLILTAVRDVLGKTEALRVTIAMGFTPDEAREMELPV